jgi:hypothetical protein
VNYRRFFAGFRRCAKLDQVAGVFHPEEHAHQHVLIGHPLPSAAFGAALSHDDKKF